MEFNMKTLFITFAFSVFALSACTTVQPLPEAAPSCALSVINDMNDAVDHGWTYRTLTNAERDRVIADMENQTDVPIEADVILLVQHATPFSDTFYVLELVNEGCVVDRVHISNEAVKRLGLESKSV